MKLEIYRCITYDFHAYPHVRYTLFVDGQYLMHYVINSYKKKIDRNVIEVLRQKVFTQQNINELLKPSKIKYCPDGKLVHQEIDTKLLKDLQIKLKIKEIEEDFNE